MKCLERLIKKIKSRARQNPKKIVFPESTEERTLKAIAIIIKEKIAIPILLGTPDEIKKAAKKHKANISKAKIVDYLSKENKKFDNYAELFCRLRKSKGITPEKAKEILKDAMYYAAMMVHTGEADGAISGAIHPTAHTVRPALQIIKTKKKFHRVSGMFLMGHKNKLLFFADSAVEIQPDAKDLAEIAIDTAETAKSLGIKPRVAMLSFSTWASANHPLADKVREATEIVKHKRKDLVIEGEIQVDAALSSEVAKIKCPGSILKGDANILIFPDLQAGNISYKIFERLGNAKAIGPILQGLNKPINDLSRGCKVDDIVDLTAITVVEAQHRLTKKHVI